MDKLLVVDICIYILMVEFVEVDICILIIMYRFIGFNFRKFEYIMVFFFD